jgi:predicted nucleic acid-binding protein
LSTALDTNIIIDLMVSGYAEHDRARRGLENLNDSLFTTHINAAECLRLLTHPKVFSKPLKIGAAVKNLDSFFSDNSLTVLNQSDKWWLDIPKIALKDIPGLAGNDIFDTQIALCLQYNGIKRIWTRDSGFKRFGFLQVIHWLDNQES